MNEEVDRLLEQAPTRHGLQMVEIQRTETQSLHWVRVWTREPRHLHARHDSTIQIQKGHGTLYLNDQPLRLTPGSVTMIPRGIPHYYVNETEGTYSQVMVLFSPPFDGQDIVPAP